MSSIKAKIDLVPPTAEDIEKHISWLARNVESSNKIEEFKTLLLHKNQNPSPDYLERKIAELEIHIDRSTKEMDELKVTFDRTPDMLKDVIKLYKKEHNWSKFNKQIRFLKYLLHWPFDKIWYVEQNAKKRS